MLDNDIVKKSATELPAILTVPEMADVLHIGRNAAYDLVKEGRIQCLRFGKAIRIPETAILEYIEKNLT